MQTSPVAIESTPAFALLCFVLAAAAMDLRQRRIPNRLTYSFALLGLVLNGFSGHWESGVMGLGFGLGSTWLLAMAVPGALGMGDVKMMAAIGSLGGVGFAAHVLVVGAAFGGLLALVAMAWRKRLGELLRRTWALLEAVVVAARSGQRAILPRAADGRTEMLPFGVALALGTIWELWRGVA